MDLEDLPDSLILNIFGFLGHVDLSSIQQVSTRLRRIALDELLWRDLFHQYFRVQPFFPDPLGHSTWSSEFKRLIDEVPFVESEVKKTHSDQVLHVAFSNDGKYYSTTAKDAFVYVWTATYPSMIVHSYNMKKYQWKYTQFSQFNDSDTILLVSGVLFGIQSTSGEIVIFDLKDFCIQCRIVNKPYDVFGTFISNNFFLSGDLTWLGSLVSKSQIWLNKASQETDSEHSAVMNKLYKFYNPKASSIRSLMVANVAPLNEEEELQSTNQEEEPNTSVQYKKKSGNKPSQSLQRHFMNACINVEPKAKGKGDFGAADYVGDIKYSTEFHTHNKKKKEESLNSPNEPDEESQPETSNAIYDSKMSTPSDDDEELDDEELKNMMGLQDELIDSREKLLIFTCGQMTFTPHQIGFKRIKPVTFKGRIDTGPYSLKDRIKEFKRRKLLENSGAEANENVDYSNYSKVADQFDKIDHIIDLHGHIIGMALSPDHRYLYCNCRSWPQDYIISDALEPPPIAEQIDIHVIDLTTMRQVGLMRGSSKKCWTSNEECFFIFLDVCDLYLGSGAEDKSGYLWDRIYGISLLKLPHEDVVNCVAFNPKDSEMMVSVSDDNTIKVWRSKKRCRELGIKEVNTGRILYDTSK